MLTIAREGQGRREKADKEGEGQGQGQRRSGPRKEGAQRKEGAKEAQQPKPKPSIYKTVQPSAPTSAPIL